MKKLIFPLALMMCLALLLSACSGAAAPATNLNVALTDFHFVPDVFTIPAGKEITLNLLNSGAVAHQFVIFKSGTNPGGNFDSADEKNIYWKVQLEPGESKTATFTAPAEPGEYVLVCGIPGHLEAGMSGKIVVVAK